MKKRSIIVELNAPTSETNIPDDPAALVSNAWRVRTVQLETALGLIVDTCAMCMKRLKENHKRVELLNAIGAIVVAVYQAGECVGLAHMPDGVVSDRAASELRASAAMIRDIWTQRVRERTEQNT